MAEPVKIEQPPITLEPQDPLPESTWLWRRAFIFALTGIIAIGVWMMVQAIVNVTANEPDLAVGAMVKVIGWLLLFGWFNSTYYLIAPSAEQLTRLIQTASLLKSNVPFLSRSSAKAPDGTTAQTEYATGPAAPAAPSEPPQAEPVPEIDAAPTAR